MELDLQGKDGEETVTVDNLGKVLDIDSSKTVDPVAGNDVYLTLIQTGRRVSIRSWSSV